MEKTSAVRPASPILVLSMAVQPFRVSMQTGEESRAMAVNRSFFLFRLGGAIGTAIIPAKAHPKNAVRKLISLGKTSATRELRSNRCCKTQATCKAERYKPAYDVSSHTEADSSSTA